MAESDVARLRQLVTNHPRVWLVYSHDWYTDPNGIISRELNHLMRRVEQQDFVGLRIMRFAAR